MDGISQKQAKILKGVNSDNPEQPTQVKTVTLRGLSPKCVMTLEMKVV